MTLSEIRDKSGLSRPTVASQVAELRELGWVEELPAVVGGGRPARTFRFNVRAGYLVGVDIGAYSVRVAVADLVGEPIVVVREGVSLDLSGRRRLSLARRVLEEVLETAHIDPREVLVVTIGTVGVVSPEGSVTHSVLPDWTRQDLVGGFAKVVDCPVFVENDANLAAIAELHHGLPDGAADMVYVLAGHRTGAALVLDGRLRRGRHGAAGEIGALEVIGWERGTRELAGAAAYGAGPVEDNATAQIFEKAAEGVPEAQAVVRDYAAALAQGIAALVLAVDPEVIVVGGGISGAHRGLLEPLEEELERVTFSSPRLVLSTLGRQAVLLGAIRAGLDFVDAELLALGDPD